MAWLARLPRTTEARACQILTDLLAGLASPRRLALALLWSTVAWACFWGFYYLALLALSVSLQPGQRLAISLGALALSPPSAPTQPGVYHASVVVPLSIVGFDEATLTSYAVILHALQMLWMVGLGIWGLSQTGASLRELLARSAIPPNT